MEIWMRRALQLASLGRATAAPNPMVGCVIVHPKKGLIGEGWHTAFGKAHAEVEAINSVKHPELLPESSLIVTLEPCAHFGKTPPCSALIIDQKLSEVIICNEDPNPLVAGKGADALRRAGIRVQSGILEKEGRELNRFFFTVQEKKRVFVTLKWASTADGFLAPEDGKPLQISGSESRLLVHRMRAAHQAIMAGRNTLRNDDPLLNLRNWPGRQPVRIIVDPKLELTKNLRVFQDDSAPTWVFNDLKEGYEGHIRFIPLPDANKVELILEKLPELGIQSLLVEGGSQLLKQFMETGLWDEAFVFTSKQKLNRGIQAPEMGVYKCIHTEKCGEDVLQQFHPFQESVQISQAFSA